MKLKQIFFNLLVICCLAAGSLFAQDKSAKPTGKDSAQNLVEVKANVLVTDASGNYIYGVKAEDIKIFEDDAEQKITRFVAKETALSVGLVVDNSGSLRTSFDEIEAAGSIIVANLRPNDDAFIIRFVDTDKIELIQDWTANKARLNEAIASMYVEGGQSAVLDAIYLSAEKIAERQAQDKSRSYALVLISDAEDIDSFYKQDKILKLLTDSGLQLFLLSYAENAPKEKKKAVDLSRFLTFKTGGTVYSLGKKHTKDELIDTLKRLVFELRAQYFVGYASTNKTRGELPRKLRVEVADGAKGEKRQGLIRADFIVPKN